MLRQVFFLLSVLLLGTISVSAFASTTDAMDLTMSGVGYASIVLFSVAYVSVMMEEFTHLRKSKPVIIAAGIIWAMIAVVYAQHGIEDVVEEALRHNILEYAELFLFLLAAMTYVNAMEERNIFNAMRAWLTRKGFSYRTLFWLTGWVAFFLSPVIDNLTTALVMCAVILAVGKDSPRFVSLACINIVIAANAGGAFSPFGDITTLMVWQKGHVDFWTFFFLFIPSVVNYVVPASFMYFAVPDKKPQGSNEEVHMKRGARVVILLFGLTIATAVSFHNFLDLPPMLGMMTGLGYLQFFGYYLKKTHRHRPSVDDVESYGTAGDVLPIHEPRGPFNIFHRIAQAEWDTLLFFYGVVVSVGGLGFIGYLALASEAMYTGLGATYANILVGILSAIVDNIPVMFAVLSMNPDMDTGQWLLVTLTAGVGGSMLSIGSAAGVALMGQARGRYTFFSHLRWTPVIALGYALSIWTHMLVNQQSFTAVAAAH